MSSLVMSDSRGKAGSERSRTRSYLAASAAASLATGTGTTGVIGGGDTKRIVIPPVQRRVGDRKDGVRPWLPSHRHREDRNVHTGERPAERMLRDTTMKDLRPMNPFFDIVDHGPDKEWFEPRSRTLAVTSVLHTAEDPLSEPLGKPVDTSSMGKLRERRRKEEKDRLFRERAERKAASTKYLHLATPSRRQDGHGDDSPTQPDWRPGGIAPPPKHVPSNRIRASASAGALPAAATAASSKLARSASPIRTEAEESRRAPDQASEGGKVRFDESNLRETRRAGRRAMRRSASSEPYIPHARPKDKTFRKPWHWMPESDQERYRLGPDEVVVSQKDMMDRQRIADRGKWATLIELHHVLGNLDSFNSANRPLELRKGAIHGNKRKKRRKKKQVDERDLDAMLETDSEDDESIGSKLAFVNASSHYISRLYESLFRAQPDFIITRNRFIVALRMFVTGGVKGKLEDTVALDAIVAPVVAHAVKVAEAFGSGEDGNFDWRELLCSLRLVSAPMSPALEQVRWFFMLYASKGVLELGRLPDLPATRIRKKHDAERAEAAVDMGMRQPPWQRRLGLPPPPPPTPPPPLDVLSLPLKQLLPSASAKYPNLQMDIRALPSMIAVPAGTTLDNWAIQSIVSSVMASPYVKDEREEGYQETLKERRERIKREMEHEPVSGVSWMYRKNFLLYFRKDVTLKAFDEMICRPPMNRLLMYRGNVDASKPSCEYEELYHPMLWDHIVQTRVAVRQQKFLRRTVERWQNLFKMRSFDGWYEKVRQRKHARKKLWVLNSHSRWSTQIKGMTMWWKFTVASTAAIDIQKVVRMFIWHHRWLRLREVSKAAIYVQKSWRAHLKVVWLREEKVRRHSAATAIGKVWRGRMGRVYTRKQVMRRVRMAQGKIRRANRAIQEMRKDSAARAIQAVYRGYLGRKLAADRLDYVNTEKRVEREMEAFGREQKRKALLVEAKAKDLAEQKALENEQRRRDLANQSRVRGLRFRREVQRLKKQQAEEVAAAEEEIYQRNKAMRKAWVETRTKIKEEVKEEVIDLLERTRNETILAAFNSFKITHKIPPKRITGDALAALDDSAMTTEQKTKQRTMFNFIFKEADRIIAEIEDRGGRSIQDDEAGGQAIGSWLKNENAKALQDVKDEEHQQLDDFRRWERETNNRISMRHGAQWKRMQGIAASKFQVNYRAYRARQERIQLAKEVYEKYEEEVSGDVYWIDTRSGARLYEKPPALRFYDVPVHFVEAPYDAYDIPAIEARKRRKAEILQEELNRQDFEERREKSMRRQAGLATTVTGGRSVRSSVVSGVTLMTAASGKSRHARPGIAPLSLGGIQEDVDPEDAY